MGLRETDGAKRERKGTAVDGELFPGPFSIRSLSSQKIFISPMKCVAFFKWEAEAEKCKISNLWSDIEGEQ